LRTSIATSGLLPYAKTVQPARAIHSISTFIPKDPPARTTCGVQLSFGMKVEIECIALAG